MQKASSKSQYVLVKSLSDSVADLVMESKTPETKQEVAIMAEPSLKNTSRSTSATAVVGKMSLPPPWKAKTYLSQTQYVNPATVTSLNITRGAVAASAGAYTHIVNSSAVTLASSFRLLSVKIWSGVAGGGGPAQQAALEWIATSAEGALGKDEPAERLYPSGIAVDGCVTFRPDPNSFHGMWNYANINATDGFFNIRNLTIGSVIQVNMEFTLASAQNSGFAFSQGSTALGVFGYPALDLPTTNQLPALAAVKAIF
jgi:hypothetical protein